ncbi:hypothetical protein ABN034_12555 [Actinopolymorpha sp. B11F2]|uniref:hypothetical protein n=1 Tax=Actinopolymorpha sp. B11F2 TaxID=3160862 RepID=UPI0032E37928
MTATWADLRFHGDADLASAVAAELRRLAGVYDAAASELAATAGYWRTDADSAEHYAVARVLVADAEALEHAGAGEGVA